MVELQSERVVEEDERQLRSVLVTFTARPNSSSTPIATVGYSSLPPRPARTINASVSVPSPRSLHHGNIRAAAAAKVRDDEPPPYHERPASTAKSSQRRDGYSARIVQRRPRVDHLTNALRHSGKGDLLFERPARKLDYTYINPRDSSSIQRARENRRRHANDPIDRRHISLQSILGHYVSAFGVSPDRRISTRKPSGILSHQELRFLRAAGYGEKDVAAWAAINSAEDTLEAAQMLKERLVIRGPLATPVFVLLNLLKRTRIGAASLRTLVQCTSLLFDGRAAALSNPGIDRQPRFLACIRLLRCAREVWPLLMPAITRMILDWYRSWQPLDCEELPLVTHQLNTLISLISLSTAERPMRDAVHQEAAIISILQYMSEHNPALQLDRGGYRGVIRVQLTQRKTPNEQQWAALKSLSWPPWKVDRTAMDEFITAQVHGMSRANQTLKRMREAGYGPLEWERHAQIYAGWDVDLTPTIQTRIIFGLPGSHLSSQRPTAMRESTRWAARIVTTRTAQEAWACYLAWEDKKFPPDSDVHLAIADKLREEERRLEQKAKTSRNKPTSAATMPGDAREVFPLPPSTHLETYTRTSVPTPEGFYEALTQQGVKIGSRLLAFLAMRARTFKRCRELLRIGASRYPTVKNVLWLDCKNLPDLPEALFFAAVHVHCRFAARLTCEHKSFVTVGVQDPLVLPTHAGITHVLRLLEGRPNAGLAVWETVYSNLAERRRLWYLAILKVRYASDQDDGDHPRDLPDHLRRSIGAIKAYRLLKLVSAMQKERRLPFDLSCFKQICAATENLALATLNILRSATSKQEDHTHSELACNSRLLELANCSRGARGLMHNVQPLKNLFWTLVGSDPTQHNCDDALSLPRLLTSVDPYVLHWYVRALGLLADYNGLLELVRWMRDHWTDLAVECQESSEGAMRRVLVALRAYLDRAWVKDRCIEHDSVSSPSVVSKRGCQAQIIEAEEWLKQFRKPASSEIINAIKEIVEDVEDWDGWPTDEEVAEYTNYEEFDPIRGDRTSTPGS